MLGNKKPTFLREDQDGIYIKIGTRRYRPDCDLERDCSHNRIALENFRRLRFCHKIAEHQEVLAALKPGECVTYSRHNDPGEASGETISVWYNTIRPDGALTQSVITWADETLPMHA